MSNLLDAIWVEYLDRETAAADAEAAKVELKLLTAARAKRNVVVEWASDQALAGSLRSLPYLLETEEAFIAEWEKRLQRSSAPRPVEPPVPPRPVAAHLPPVTSVQVFASARIVGRRASARWSQLQSAAALVATVALLAVVAIAFWIVRGEGRVARQVNPPPQKPIPAPPAQLTQEANPTLEEPLRLGPSAPGLQDKRITPVVWQSGGPHNQRLPRGEHRLTSGLVELVAGRATPVTIIAPAAVRVGDDDVWFMRQGTLTVSDPPSGERLPIATPSSQIQSQGAEFIVSVNAAGQTNVQVRRGEVHLRSAAAGEHAEPLKLLAGEFERAQLSPPGSQPGERPAFCQLQGPEDRFCGLIELAGKSLRFRSPQEFSEFQKQVEEQFAKDAAELRAQWPELVRALGGLGGGEIQLELDGQPLEIQTLEQLLELLKQLPAPPGAGDAQTAPAQPGKPGLPKPGDARGAGSSFQGTIVINGEEQKFDSVEEFNAARQKMLEQLGPLPIDPFEQLKELELPDGLLP